MPLFPKRLLLPAAAAVLGLSLASCSAGESADAGEATPSANIWTQAADVSVSNIGDTVTVPMSEGNVAAVTVAAVERPESVEGRPHQTASPEKGFVRVQVLWKTEEGVTDARATSFTLVDQEGRLTAAEPLVMDAATLWSDDIPAGEAEDGYLTFDVEDGPQTLILRDSAREDIAYFKVP